MIIRPAPRLIYSRIIGVWVSRKFEPAHTAWRRLSKFQRNFVVGIIIAIVLHFSHNIALVSQMENLAMDSMMFINQSTSRMATGANRVESLPFTFIDINEDTYRTWGEPFYIPRDKLLRIIQYAVEGNAKAVVLNIELSGVSDKDTDLLSYLRAYNKKLPPLFLLRSFYPKSESTNQKSYHIRPSILDDNFISTNNIYWVQPIFKLSAYDQVVRYWQLIAPGCLNNQSVLVPSFQLLIDAYLGSGDDLSIVVNQLEKLSPKTCVEIEEVAKSLRGEIYYTGKKIELSREAYERIGERIIYTLPWEFESKSELFYRPAHKITEAEKGLSYSAVKGRIVIIGASYNDSGELYETPLGEMPGALIILNAIKSLHLFGQIKPPPSIVKWMLELGLITLMSWVFTRYRSFVGAMISAVIIASMLVPVSFYLFKYGLWIDFAAPLLGIRCYQWLSELEERTTNRYQHNELQTSEFEKTTR